VREPPVGHYFDPSEPTVEATVRSLNQTSLVYEPGSHTKYSNAGITVVGYVLERRKNMPYARYVKRAVLEPMGLRNSAFEPEPALIQNLAKAYMWTYDGRTFAAPTFQLGIGPAGCLYTSVIDLGQFLSILFAGGRGPNGQILKPETLKEMWQPQFARPGETTGFGIGFHLASLDGHRLIGHGGAIYGYATELAALPDDRLGVVAVTTNDSANAVMNHIAHEALRLMLALRASKPLPEIPLTQPLDAAIARKLDGRWGDGANSFDLTERNGKLDYLSVRGGQQIEVRQAKDTLILDGKLGFGMKIVADAATLDATSQEDRTIDSVRINGRRMVRVSVPKPPPAPDRRRGLIGEYGWDHDTLYILERDGKLTALIEWYDYYPLEEISPDVFRFPNWGLYDGETLVFHRGANGRTTDAVLSGAVVFERRKIAGEDQTSAHIEAAKPVAELRRDAMSATPPKESGDFRQPNLVELTSLDSTIKLDIRYATTNNFLRTVFYPQARAFLQRPAAEAVVRANQKLKSLGYGLLIHDSYRPWYVTRMFWDGTPPEKHIFVADPSQGSRHNRGCAVDLTLYDLKTGQPVEMVGLYDEMSERSYPNYPGGTSLARWHRQALRRAMENEGFTVYEFEWWHFDYKDWRNYPILNTDAGAF
jgi:D-alanyl-D-alanine dipeptidase